MKIENYVKEVKSCITKEDVERFLIEYEPKRSSNAKINGKRINRREFLTFILNNCEKVCANQIKEKIYKEWNNPGNLARKFFEDIFQEKFSLENENKNNSSYQIPDIQYIKNDEEDLKSINGDGLLYKIQNFVKELKESDLFNELFWEEALKQKHFMPLFAEILAIKNNDEELIQFLKENFYEDIEKKVKEEIEKDLENLGSENPEINKTSLIYTRHELFFNFFNSNNDQEVWQMLGLNRFYDDGIFDDLLMLREEDSLNDVNFYLLASLVKWDFNEEFFTGYKNPIGNILDLEYKYPSEDEQNAIFADEILCKMFREIDKFYFILRSGEFYDIANYLKASNSLIDYFYDKDFKKEALKTYIENEFDLPSAFIESCEELQDLFSEEELEEFAEKIGYESFEEVCDEYEEYFFDNGDLY